MKWLFYNVKTVAIILILSSRNILRDNFKKIFRHLIQISIIRQILVAIYVIYRGYWLRRTILLLLLLIFLYRLFNIHSLLKSKYFWALSSCNLVPNFSNNLSKLQKLVCSKSAQIFINFFQTSFNFIILFCFFLLIKFTLNQIHIFNIVLIYYIIIWISWCQACIVYWAVITWGRI